MTQLINFWTNLVKSNEQTIDAVPNTIKIAVIKNLIKDGVLTDTDIDVVRSAKIAEMSIACNHIITSGFDIVLSDKETHHFSLQTADQLNISKLNDRAKAGNEILPYHADGEPCKFYAKEDIYAMNTTMENLIQFHVTYFNSLRDYITNTSDFNTVCNINYGDEIPAEYQSEVLVALYAQMQASK